MVWVFGSFSLISYFSFFPLFIHIIALRFVSENINVRVDQCFNDQEGEGGVWQRSSWLSCWGFVTISWTKRKFVECNEQVCFRGGQANLNVFLSCRRWSPSSKEGDLPHLPLLKLLANRSPIPGRGNTFLTPVSIFLPTQTEIRLVFEII